MQTCTVARSGCEPRSGRYADVRPTLIHTEINEWTSAEAEPALLPPDRLDFQGHLGGTDGMSRFRKAAEGTMDRTDLVT